MDDIWTPVNMFNFSSFMTQERLIHCWCLLIWLWGLTLAAVDMSCTPPVGRSKSIWKNTNILPLHHVSNSRPTGQIRPITSFYAAHQSFCVLDRLNAMDKYYFSRGLLLNFVFMCHSSYSSDILRPFRTRPGTGSTLNSSSTWRTGSTCVPYVNLCATPLSLSSH